MEFRDKYIDSAAKIFKVRLIIFCVIGFVFAAILIFCFAMGLSSGDYMMVKANTSGEKIVLTQELLKEDYKEYVEAEKKPQMISFYCVSALTAACFVTPIVIFIAKKKRGTFRAWNLAYLIPIFCASFLLLLFAYMLSGSVKCVKAVGKPCEVDIIRVTDKETEVSVDDETNSTHTRYYVTFSNKKFHTRVEQAEYETFIEGEEYYAAKCEGHTFRYYPVNGYESE